MKMIGLQYEPGLAIFKVVFSFLLVFMLLLSLTNICKEEQSWNFLNVREGQLTVDDQSVRLEC